MVLLLLPLFAILGGIPWTKSPGFGCCACTTVSAQPRARDVLNAIRPGEPATIDQSRNPRDQGTRLARPGPSHQYQRPSPCVAAANWASSNPASHLLGDDTGLVSHGEYPISVKRSRSSRRARNNLDLTVPAGTWKICVHSCREMSCRWNRISTPRSRAGNSASRAVKAIRRRVVLSL
jgi:hypothetical protein